MPSHTTVREVLSLVDYSVLEQTAAETEVDYQVKKLNGDVMFKLLLMTLLDEGKVSLRVMENLYQSGRFKLFAHLEQQASTKFNSLSDRLACIKVDFFEKMFEQTFSTLKSFISKEELMHHHLRAFDTTTICASATFLNLGMVTGPKTKEGTHRLRHLKFGVGLWQGLPCKVQLFTEQKHLSESITLSEMLLQSSFDKDDIVLFDAGLKKRETFAQLNTQGIFFVTRLSPSTVFEVIEDYPAQSGEDWESDTLDIHSDQKVYLFGSNHHRRIEVPFRLIRATIKETNEPLFILTNIERLSDEQWVGAAIITGMYRNRWDIEVFFKVLKQHLHVKHFLSYSNNGIKVMMYMSLIAAMLLLWYKRQNQIKSYKFSKLAFVQELDMEIIKEIVVICGGDPRKSPFLNPA